MLTAGQEWIQYAGTDFWQVLYMPYFETQINFDSSIKLERLISQAINFDLGKFKTSLFYSNIFRDNGQYCLGFGWSTEVIELQLSTLIDFVNCYKYIITDLCAIGETISNNESKWIDECQPSGNTAKIFFKDWVLQENLYDYNTSAQQLISLIGGTALDNRGCWQFAWWSKWTPYVARMSFLGAKHMLANTDSHHEASFDQFYSNIENGESTLFTH